MKRLKNSMLAILLCAGMLMTGCASGKNGKGDQDMTWTQSSAIYEVNVRQYTEEGTFNAFAEHLDEIKAMGIDILWFMPIHPISEKNRSGKLGSYYSITDYKEVNPEFGTKEDFKKLVDTAHDKGFKVMMDWVANHTGWDCEWIEKHPDWYTQDSKGNVISPLNMGWPDVADLNFDNKDMRKEMISCMKYWVEEFDIDGFRCDYATGVPVDFWEDARTEIEKVKPVYMLAEDGKTTSLLKKAFDSNYNWDLYDALVQVANGNKKADKLKIYLTKDYPEGSYPLNFIDNHDKNSYEGTIIQNFGVEKLPAMFSFIYMIPGTPLVYSSDEAGIDHAIAFMEKDTIKWNKGEADYRPLITELGKIRKDNEALWAGEAGGAIEIVDCGNASVMAFTREKNGNKITCIFNLSKTEQSIDATKLGTDKGTVLLHGANNSVMEMDDRDLASGELAKDMTLQAWEFWIIKE